MQKSAEVGQQMGTEFDFNAGAQGKEDGIARAKAAKEERVALARATARQIAQNHPEKLCTIDDVQRVLIPEGQHLGMAAGSVFRTKEWEFVGFKKSVRSTNHTRPISVWKHVGN